MIPPSFEAQEPGPHHLKDCQSLSPTLVVVRNVERDRSAARASSSLFQGRLKLDLCGRVPINRRRPPNAFVKLFWRSRRGMARGFGGWRGGCRRVGGERFLGELADELGGETLARECDPLRLRGC
jgi:hypothetical protein